LVRAALTASSTYSAIWSSVKYARPKAPAAAARAHLAPAVCSAITVTDRRTSGRTSAASVPSARATSTTSYSLARPGHHLHHARVLGAGQLLDPAQQLDLGGAVQRRNGVHRVERCGCRLPFCGHSRTSRAGSAPTPKSSAP
jgi:hypothetical protein